MADFTLTVKALPSGTWTFLAGDASLLVIADGTANTYRRSTDGGDTWSSSQTFPYSGDTYVLAWNGTQMLAIDDSGATAVSTDGSSWTSGSIPSMGTGGYPTYAASDGSTWLVGIGSTGKISRSTNGSTWSTTTPFSTRVPDGVYPCWDGAQFAVITRGYDGSRDRTSFWTSPTGVTWTEIDADVTGGNDSLLLRAGLLSNGTVAIFSGEWTHYSDDAGASWSPVTTTNAALERLGLIDGVFIGNDTGDAITDWQVSSNGATWGAVTFYGDTPTDYYFAFNSAQPDTGTLYGMNASNELIIVTGSAPPPFWTAYVKTEESL